VSTANKKIVKFMKKHPIIPTNIVEKILGRVIEDDLGLKRISREISRVHINSGIKTR